LRQVIAALDNVEVPKLRVSHAMRQLHEHEPSVAENDSLRG
jgi:hypothetical protein